VSLCESFGDKQIIPAFCLAASGPVTDLQGPLIKNHHIKAGQLYEKAGGLSREITTEVFHVFMMP
jgi:hypothetical protein